MRHVQSGVPTNTRLSTIGALLLGALVVAACGDDSADAGPGGAGAEGGSGGRGGEGGAGAGDVGGQGNVGGQGGGGGALTPNDCGDFDVETETWTVNVDPEAGDFTLEEALDDLPAGDGPLRAVITTALGEITCTLNPDVAPRGVANFVGLARGRRAYKDLSIPAWVRGPHFYDGLTFHRLLDDFVAQGGDPEGDGTGGPGYSFADEIGELSHVPGALAYANSGPDTNGSQFYMVAEVPADFLDGGYTIFGLCSPVSVIQALTEVPVNDPKAGDPVEPVFIDKICVSRQ